MNIDKTNMLPVNNYYKEETNKTQIVIHHTVSGEGISGDVATFKASTEHVATHFLVERNGTIHQLIDLKYWANHLGLKNAHFASFGLNYTNLNKTSIGIELDSWGALLSSGGSCYPIAIKNNPKAVKYFEEYCSRYRGQRYYEKYTTQQLNSLKELLVYLCSTFSIPADYKGDRFWQQNRYVLSGEKGVWGHCSYRSDKSDPHPQPELVKLLKELKIEN
jgi:N-acetyl-anhydromuramyl-L-alanine amidase AmpD